MFSEHSLRWYIFAKYCTLGEKQEFYKLIQINLVLFYHNLIYSFQFLCEILMYWESVFFWRVDIILLFISIIIIQAKREKKKNKTYLLSILKHFTWLQNIDIVKMRFVKYHIVTILKKKKRFIYKEKKIIILTVSKANYERKKYNF